jgi:hypothetical protein
VTSFPNKLDNELQAESPAIRRSSLLLYSNLQHSPNGDPILQMRAQMKWCPPNLRTAMRNLELGMSIQTACSLSAQRLSSFEIRSAGFDEGGAKLDVSIESRLDFFFMALTICFGSVATSGRATQKRVLEERG